MHLAGPKAWWDAMREWNTEARATLANIIYDWRMKRLATDVIRHLLHAVGTVWKPDADPPEAPGRALRRVVDSDPERYLFKGRSVALTGTDCSRVMTAQDLLEFNLDASILAIGFSGSLTQKEIADLERLGPGDAALGTMRTLRPLAWITRSRDLEQGRAAAEKAANYVRDALGLQHLRADDHLLEIRYPRAALRDVPVVTPTFIEGCPSLIYRSKDAGDGWGRAVNLQGLDDGLPEAVHAEVPFTAAFRIRAIGALYSPLADPDSDLFLERMPEAWDRTTLDDLEAM
jgi:hypothetical protein